MSREKLFVGGFLLLGILCFVALLRPELLGLGTRSTGSDNSVGELRRREGDVRRKATGEIVWHDMLETQIKVADGDTVFTGPTGNADLSLDVGAQATLFPNSIVVIHRDMLPVDGDSSWLSRLGRFFHRKTVGSRIALQSGLLHVQGLSRGRPIELESNGAVYRLESISLKSSADLSLSPQTGGQPGRLSIAAEPGTELRLVPLGAPDMPKASAESRSPIESTTVLSSIILEPAKVSTRIFDEEHFDYIPVKLQWRSVSGIENYHVRVLHGERPILDRDIVATEFEFKLTELDQEPYTYQVSAVVKSGVEIASAKKQLDVEITSPRVTLPESTEPIRKSSDFVIAWERTLLTNLYRIQIAKDPDFKLLRLDRQTGLNVLPFRSREVGSLYVRVKSLSRQSETPWSAPRELQIR
jgi:hypothetical protein